MLDTARNILGLPVLASEHGAQIDQLLGIIHLIMLVAFILWGVFFVVPLFRFRKSKRPQAVYRGLKSWIPWVFVAAMAGLEGLLLFNYSIPFWDEHVAAETVVTNEGEEPFRVRVVAQQFAWIIHYPGPDGVFGETSPEYVDDLTNIVGLIPDDPNGDDDVFLQRRLHVPVDRPVEVSLTSKDVIHSFSLPEFRVKHDAIPGMVVPVRFKPTMTTKEFQALPGNEDRGFEIVCAQLCGILHYSMRGFLTVQTQEEFDAWYEEELAAKQDMFWGI